MILVRVHIRIYTRAASVKNVKESFCSQDLLSAWVLILPVYLLFMIPWTICLIVYRYVVTPPPPV